MKHPHHNGVPILIGDRIKITDGEEVTDWLIVDEVRFGPQGVPWIDYRYTEEEARRAGEVVIVMEDKNVHDHARWVIEHKSRS